MSSCLSAMALAAYVASQAGDELGAGVAGEPLKALVFRPRLRSSTLVALALDNGTNIAATALVLAGAAFLRPSRLRGRRASPGGAILPGRHHPLGVAMVARQRWAVERTHPAA